MGSRAPHTVYVECARCGVTRHHPTHQRGDAARALSAECPHHNAAISHTRITRLVGALGAGAYLASAVIGLSAILTGTAGADSAWLTGLPVLAPFGAAFGAVLARCTKHWLLPRVPRRTVLLTFAGSITLPLATVIGSLPPSPVWHMATLAAGGAISLAYYLRASR